MYRRQLFTQGDTYGIMDPVGGDNQDSPWFGQPLTQFLQGIHRGLMPDQDIGGTVGNEQSGQALKHDDRSIMK